jgi:Cu-Zn family superoxide dismutase
MRLLSAALVVAVIVAFSLVIGCQSAEAAGKTAIAEMKATAGNTVAGKVTFEQLSGRQVKVTAHLTGLKPGKHGFHVHEKGDCSAPDATSAGGHFNPTKKEHGEPSAMHHMGDLGNIEAGSDGMAHYETTVDFIEMEGPNSVIGKAVIVHADPDDMKSQPTGNAGARQACGIIEAQK